MNNGDYKNNFLITGISVSIMFVCVMIFGFYGKPTEMGLIIVAGSISIAFLNIDRIQKFKGGGFEAEMREANEVVEKANDTIEQLRKLAASLVESDLVVLMGGNFISSTTLSKRLEVHDSLISSLEEVGVSKQQIEKADKMWRKGVGVIYLRGIICCLGEQKEISTINFDASLKAREASDQLHRLLDFNNWDAPSSKEIKEFIESKSLMTQQLSDLIDDYAFFEKNGAIQRRDVFVKL